MKYQHITRAIVSRPWAIDPESVAWAAILDVLALRAAGDVLSDAEIEARIAAAGNGPRAGRARNRNVAVIPVYGVLSPRGNMLARSSGGMTAESIRDEFRAALEDADVDGIVFDVDSPGGVVEGIDELASEIRAARGTKPMAAVANHMMASAAYWLASAVDEVVATPSASVGSIGIFTAHQDVSGAMEREGIRTTLISAGRYKVEGNRFEALSDEARVAVQEQVDEWYSVMTRSIAASRGVSVDAVRGEAYGEGRTFLAKKALASGMVDRIDSLENTIRRVARGAVSSRSAGRASAESGIPYVVGVATDDETDQVGAASVPTFVARVEAASAEVRAIRLEARRRAENRAADGRAPSEADLAALAALAASIEDEAPAEEDDETEVVDPETESTEATRVGRRASLEILEAATRGGYALPH